MGESNDLHPLDEAVLLKCVVHLDYEVGMLLGLLDLPVTRAAKPHDFARPETLHYLSRLEALVVHLRVLDEFLCGPFESTYKDDVFARHYLSNWDPPKSVIGTDARVRANKQLAHLSTIRATKQGAWAFRPLVESVAKEFMRFVEALGPESDFAKAFAPTRERLASFLQTSGHAGK